MQNIKEELSYFLRTGSLKNLPFGITREAFFNILEPSDYTYPESSEKFSIISYGITEFYFSEYHAYQQFDGLVIKPPYHVADKQHLNFQLQSEWLNYRTTYQEVITNLQHLNIDFVKKKDQVDQHIIETSGGVAIMFYDDEEQDMSNWDVCKIGKFYFD